MNDNTKATKPLEHKCVAPLSLASWRHGNVTVFCREAIVCRLNYANRLHRFCDCKPIDRKPE